ncbi:VWA domain-containing protein [Candidatus Magnetominusculus dajiuhuensis]|uniref:VWA domain-containing protein n=1 Tax=Candidatus Magnetominusculus dajiuhuensis TaxID=3137712 RepID=UPI003B42FFF9
MPVKSVLRYVYSQRFKTAFYVFFALMLCYSFAFGQQAPSQDAPSIEISDISTTGDGKVSASVAIVDKDGNPIGGLKKDSFSLHIDDKRIPDFSFKQTSDAPLSVIIAVDVSGSMKGVPIVEAKKIITQFMGYLKESDYAALVTFGVGVSKVIGFTKDKNIIYNKVDELSANENRTVLFKAVSECVKLSASSATPKTAILLITDSKDEHSSIKEADVIAAVRQAHIPIYTVALGKYEYIGFLKRISEISGGEFFLFPKYEDVAHLAKAAASGLKAVYLFEFPFTAANGKYTAIVKLNYNGVDVNATKEFTNNVPKDSKPPIGSSPAYAIGNASTGVERPVNRVLIYLLIGLSAISVALLVYLALKGKKPPHLDERQSAEITKLHGGIAATADMLTKIDAEIKTVSEKNMESSAALSSEINAVGEQISTVSAHIDDAANSIKTSIADTRQALTEAAAARHEKGVAGLHAIKEEMSAIKGVIAEKNEEFTAALSSEINAVGGQISSVSVHIDDAANSIKNKITDTRLALTEAANARHEEGVAELHAIKEEMSAIKGGIADNTAELTAALSSGIKAVGEQISTVSRQIDDAVTAMKHGVVELRRNLNDASQQKFEQEFAGLRAEISAIEEVLSAIMARQIEHSERVSLESANSLTAAISMSETIYKDNIAAIEKVQLRLNEIDSLITKLDVEVKKYASAGLDTGTALTNKLNALEEIIEEKIEGKISDMPLHMDASLDAMKYGIVDLVNTIMDIEKTHGLTPGQTFEKIEGRIIEIETSITMLAAEIKKGPTEPTDESKAVVDEIKTMQQRISDISRQMEDAVYAVKDSITGMETGIMEASAAMYAREISGMRKEVASVRDALGEVMRFLLIMSE